MLMPRSCAQILSPPCRAQDSAFLVGGWWKVGSTCICKGLPWTLCLHLLKKKGRPSRPHVRERETSWWGAWEELKSPQCLGVQKEGESLLKRPPRVFPGRAL